MSDEFVSSASSSSSGGGNSDNSDSIGFRSSSGSNGSRATCEGDPFPVAAKSTGLTDRFGGKIDRRRKVAEQDTVVISDAAATDNNVNISELEVDRMSFCLQGLVLPADISVIAVRDNKLYVTAEQSPSVIYVYALDAPQKPAGRIFTQRYHVGKTSIVGLKLTTSGSGRGPLCVLTYMADCPQDKNKISWYGKDRRLLKLFTLHEVPMVESFNIDSRFDDLLVLDALHCLHIFDADGEPVCRADLGWTTVLSLPRASGPGSNRYLMLVESSAELPTKVRRLEGSVLPVQLHDLARVGHISALVEVPLDLASDRFLLLNLTPTGVAIRVVDQECRPCSPTLSATCESRLFYRLDAPDVSYEHAGQRLLLCGASDLLSIDVSPLLPYVKRR